jgi:ABC-type sugar transport system ATPase subunit
MPILTADQQGGADEEIVGRVAIRGVSKRFGDVTAVDDLTLEVADEEFLVLLGPSGCGKSTALRIIAGLEEPSDGTIEIGDRQVNDVEAKDRDVAMVFQSYALYPHMTVRRNVEFPLKTRRVPTGSRGRSSAGRRRSSWTSRSRTSTPSCGCRRAPSWSSSAAACGRRSCTSPTTRSKR